MDCKKKTKTAVRYTPAEDEIFQRVLDEEDGDFNKARKRLQKIFPRSIGRTPRSIKEHLMRFLPENKKEFTQEEINLLFKLYNQYGPRWSKITKQLGRTHAPIVRSKLLSLMRQNDNLKRFGYPQLPFLDPEQIFVPQIVQPEPPINNNDVEIQTNSDEDFLDDIYEDHFKFFNDEELEF